jgi:hypothetical protein
MFARSIALHAWALVLVTLVGCASDRHRDIPTDARLVTEGDKTLTYQFDRPGTVYIFDSDTDKMVYSGKVDRGQMLRVEPDKNRIVLDGKVVRDEDMKTRDTRRVFFEPSDDRRTVIVEERKESR